MYFPTILFHKKIPGKLFCFGKAVTTIMETLTRVTHAYVILRDLWYDNLLFLSLERFGKNHCQYFLSEFNGPCIYRGFAV